MGALAAAAACRRLGPSFRALRLLMAAACDQDPTAAGAMIALAIVLVFAVMISLSMR